MVTRRSILIVEDHWVMQTLWEKFLAKFYNVTTTARGEDALEYAQRVRYDIALIDIGLAGNLSGFDVDRGLRQIDKRLISVLTTMSPEQHFHRNNCYAQEMVQKTLDTKFLKQLFDSLLKRRDNPEITENQMRILCELMQYSTAIDYEGMSGESSGAVRFSGRLSNNDKPLTWITYVDNKISPDRIVVGLASTIGCVGGCKFCYSGFNRRVHRLSAEEMITQATIAISRSPHAVGIFDGSNSMKATINWTCEGDPVISNLHNACMAVSKMSQVYLDWDFIFTTMGSKENLEEFRCSYSHLPIRFYWSLHFRPEYRSKLMPAMKNQNVEEIRNVFVKIAKRTSKRVTVAWALLPGVNDRNEDVQYLKDLFAGKPFQVKLTPMRRGCLDFSREADDEQVYEFGEKLGKAGVSYRIRNLIGFNKSTCGQTVYINGHVESAQLPQHTLDLTQFK